MADVQDAGHAEVDDHLASDSADPSSNDAMAAAEAATASALLSGSAEMEQHHGSTPVPIPVVHAEADSDSSSEAGSDRVLSLGALLPQGFRLHQDQVHPHSEEFPLPPHPQLARLLPEGNQVRVLGSCSAVFPSCLHHGLFLCAAAEALICAF